MPHTPKMPATVELARYEKRLIAALKEVRTGCSLPCRDTYVINLVKDLLSKGRLAAIRQLLAILSDAKDREASKASLLAFADEWKAVIESMYADEEATAPVSMSSAHLEEETAEARKDIAEARFIHERTGQAALEVIRADREYRVKSNRFVKCAIDVFHRGGAA